MSPTLTPLKSNTLKTILKIVFSLGALWFIFQHLDANALLEQAKKLSFVTLVAVLCIALIGHYIAAMRLHFYCRTKQVGIAPKKTTRLYFIGLFFNTILPGGIGGDGYIAVILKHLHQLPMKQGIGILLRARASGLLILVILTIAASYAAHFATQFPSAYTMLAMLCVLAILTYSLAARYILQEPYLVQLRASIYSIGVQGVIAIFLFIMLVDIGAPSHLIWDYLALLLLSNILVIIPISIGGLGLRELAFLYGSQLIGLNAEIGVTISLMLYLLSLVFGLVGLGIFLKEKRT